MKTRAELLALVVQYILSGGRRTIAEGVRIVLGWIISSSPNIADDADQPNGYASLSSSGFISPDVLPPAIENTTIDITGLTDIDLTGLSGTSIINVTSSNANETIDTFSNLPATLYFIYLCPATGLTLNVNDKSVNSGNIRLSSNTLTILGAKNGFLSLINRSAKIFQLNFIDQYV